VVKKGELEAAEVVPGIKDLGAMEIMETKDKGTSKT
jgi:hypothetical protein